MTALGGTTKGSWCGSNSTLVRQRTVGSGQTDAGRRGMCFPLCAAAAPRDARPHVITPNRRAKTVSVLSMGILRLLKARRPIRTILIGRRAFDDCLSGGEGGIRTHGT